MSILQAEGDVEVDDAALPPAAPGRSSTPPMWLLVTVTFSGTMAMHMFVPALPAAALDLHASAAAVQAAISVYILGLGFGQLFYGPLADGFGRRPTLLLGLAIFTVAGVVAALATSVQWLVAARPAQALGGCAGLLMGRAIVRDVSEPHELMSRMALLSLMTMIGPGLSPLVGATISADFGWRWIFVLLVGLGLFNLVATWRVLPETGSPHGTMNLRRVRDDYVTLLKTPSFLWFAVGGACITTSFYAFIASAPFIWAHQLHRPAREVGIYLGALIVGVCLGNVVANRARGIPTTRILLRSSVLTLASGVFLLVVTLGMPSLLSAPLIGTAMFFFSLGAGMCSPAAMAKSVSGHARLAGSAAGLYGAMQFAVGAMCTSLTAVGGAANPTLSAAVVMVAVAGLGLLSVARGLRTESAASKVLASSAAGG